MFCLDKDAKNIFCLRLYDLIINKFFFKFFRLNIKDVRLVKKRI